MAITRQQVLDSIHKGFGDADSKYERWTNGSSVAYAGVESLIVANVAEAVNDLQESHEHLYLEYPFSDILENSGAKFRLDRLPETLQGGKRADIVLFNRFRSPTCVIELKRTWNADQCLNDLERIRDLVDTCSHNNGGSLRRDFLAMWIAKEETTTKSGENRIREQESKIISVVNDKFDKMSFRVTFHLSVIREAGEEFRERFPGWRAGSLCIEIAV